MRNSSLLFVVDHFGFPGLRTGNTVFWPTLKDQHNPGLDPNLPVSVTEHTRRTVTRNRMKKTATDICKPGHLAEWIMVGK